MPLLSAIGRELKNVAGSTSQLSSEIGWAIANLNDHNERAAAAQAIHSAVSRMQLAEETFSGLALAVRQLALLPQNAPETVHDEIWRSVGLDQHSPPSSIPKSGVDIEAISIKFLPKV